MNRVVVLNADYSIIGTISWKRAIVLILKKKAEAVKNTTKIVSSELFEIVIPAIIKLINFVNMFGLTKVKFSKKNVHFRDNYTCAYCGKKVNNHYTMDHIIPKSRGGKSSFENCVTCCKNCNKKKGNKTPSEANMILSHIPDEPTVYEFIKSQVENINMFDELKELGFV